MISSILLATRNLGKVREIQEYLQPLGIEVAPLPADAPIVEETGDTFEENARLKAETIMQKYRVPVLADDSGLEVDALNGQPGVYSARYAGEFATDEQNNQKLLKQLHAIGAFDKPCTARFVSVLAFAHPTQHTRYVKGICEGQILSAPRGDGGFGYDPLFFLSGANQTLAELSVTEKNQVSHRAKALEQFVELLQMAYI